MYLIYLQSAVFLRYSAIYALGRIRNETTLNVLINALNDEEISVRIAAINVLVLDRINNTATIHAIINALNDDNFEVYTKAALALGEIGHEAAVHPLINVLNHGDLSVRSKAAFALGKFENEAAADALLYTLNDDESYIRYYAASALSNIIPNSKIPQLWGIMLNGKIKAKEAILKTQERYKFYNYEIFPS